LNVLPSCKFTKSSKVWIFFSFSLIHFIMKFKSFAWKLMRGGRGNWYSMKCFVCGKKYFDHTFCAMQMGSEKPWSQCCLWSWKATTFLTLQVRLLHLNSKWCSNQLDIKTTSYH
jgi:hypothetical protein